MSNNFVWFESKATFASSFYNLLDTPLKDQDTNSSCLLEFSGNKDFLKKDIMCVLTSDVAIKPICVKRARMDCATYVHVFYNSDEEVLAAAKCIFGRNANGILNKVITWKTTEWICSPAIYLKRYDGKQDDAKQDERESGQNEEKYDWGNNSVRVTVSVPKAVLDSKASDENIGGIDSQSIWYLLRQFSTDGIPARASFTHPTNGSLEAVAIFNADTIRWANEHMRSQYCARLTQQELQDMMEAKFGKNYEQSEVFKQAKTAANKKMQQFQHKQKKKKKSGSSK